MLLKLLTWWELLKPLTLLSSEIVDIVANLKLINSTITILLCGVDLTDENRKGVSPLPRPAQSLALVCEALRSQVDI